tara:strand:+ start:1153 stop:3159 length:2007 start_codon:yes stop_codon:yes gene_type:complete
VSKNDEVKIDITVENAEALRKFGATDDALKNIKGSAAEFTRGLAEGMGVIAAVAGATVAFGFKVAELSAEFETSQRAATLLGSAYAQVDLATRGAISAQTALRAQQTLVQSGLQLTGVQLGVVARAARDYALATGTEASQALEQLTDALRTGSSEGLGRFGIAIADTHSRTGNFTAALNSLTAAQQGHAAAALTSAEQLEKLKTGLTFLAGEAASFLAGSGAGMLNWISTFGAGVNASRHGLTGLIGEISEANGVAAANRARQTADAARAPTDANRARFNARLTAGNIQMSESQIARIGGGQGMRGLTNEERNQLVMSGRHDGTLDQAQFERNIETFERQHYERLNRELMAAEPARIEALKASERAKRASRGTTSGGGGGGAPSARATHADTRRFASVDALFEEMRSSILRDVEADRENEVIALQGASDRREAMRADRFTRQSGERSHAQTTASKAEEERRNSMGGHLASALGVSDSMADTQSKIWTGYADMAVGSISKVTQAFETHFAAVIAGKETMGEALLHGANEVSTALALEAFPKAIMETAAGYAALASLLPPVMATAPLHFAAATMYGSIAAVSGAVALGTGIGIAATAPASGGSAGASDVNAAKSASGRSIGSGDKGGGNTTIVISSLVPPGPQELQGLVRASRQAGRYGLSAATPRQVRI